MNPSSGGIVSLMLVLPALVHMGFSHCQAQEPTRFISSVGYRIGTPHAIERAPGVINLRRFGFDGSGSSANHTFTFGTGLLFPVHLIPRFSLGGTLHIAHSYGSFLSNPYNEYSSAITEETSEPVPTRNIFRIDAIESQLQLELVGEWRLPTGVSLSAGPWVGYRLASDITQTEEITEPSGAIFTDARNRERVIAAGRPINSFGWRFGGMGKVGYDFSFNFGIVLRPELTARFDMEALADKGLGRRAFDAGLSLALLLPLSPGRSSPRDSSLFNPPEYALRTSVDLYSGDERSADRKDTPLITTKRTVYHTYIPLVPTLRFSGDASSLPSGCAVLTRSQTAHFSIDTIRSDLPASLNANLPNIIGKRMQASPGDTLRLQGKPASAVREYLTDVWSIDPERIIVGTGEGDDVEMFSSSSDLLAPVVNRWVVEDYGTSPIRLKKDIVAEAGLREWHVTLFREGVMIHRFSGDAEETDPVSLNLSLDMFGRQTGKVSLGAELVATDRTGRTDTAYDSINLEIEKAKTGKEVHVVYLLYPRSGRGTDEWNDALLGFIPSIVESGTGLVIEPSEKNVAEGHLRTIVERLPAECEAKGIIPRDIRISGAGTPAESSDVPFIRIEARREIEEAKQ